METDNQLPYFITLGQRLQILKTTTNAQKLVSVIPQFLESLDECSLERSRTAAKPLSAITSIPYDPLGNVKTVALEQIRAYAETVEHTIYEESGSRTLVPVDVTSVVASLRNLESTITLSPSQVLLCNETISCIEHGAYRAATVMGWNLAYDYIRQWIFDNHLGDFNRKLTTEYLRKNGKSVYSEIVEYADFFQGTPSERTVIDTCFKSGMFGEKTQENLRFLLRRRNNYAHPTFRAPSIEQTNAYVKDLLDIICDAPFFVSRPSSGISAK